MYPGTFARTDPGRIAAVMGGTGEQLSYAELEDGSRGPAGCCTTRACGAAT